MKRFSVIIIFFLVLGCAVLFRLGYLQIICHEEYSVKADSQEFHTVELDEVTRGGIMDRNGITLTSSSSAMCLLIVPFLVENAENMAERVCEIVALSPQKLIDKTEGKNSDGDIVKRKAFVAKTDLSSEEAAAVEDLNESGVYVVFRNERYYGDYPAQHLLGSIAKNKDGQMIGVSGLEKIYDDTLSSGGIASVSFLIDEKNRIIDPGEYYISTEGKKKTGNIETSIDLDMQRAAEAALGDQKGAVVILDAQNGDVLSLASSPKYDPYLTTELRSDDVYVNKALSSFPPASLFKIFVSAVALEEGVVARESTFYCDGSYRMSNGEIVRCWKKEGHGFLTFEESLSQSCNPVFIQTALLLGEDRLKAAFKKWELDQDDLLGYPLDDRSSLTFDGRGESVLANVALGESGVLLTPLNVAKMINVIASEGKITVPRVITQVNEASGNTVFNYDSALSVSVISPSTAKTVKDMMKKTFQEGTAENLNLEAFHVAGKTGTSETGNVWIGGFFPFDDPKYTVVVMVSEGTSGVGDAGPVMKKICAYLGNLP